jgi:hypothetical protein
MDLDSLHPIPEVSRWALRELIRRIEHSKTEEQLVYRECEIDEVWRLLGPNMSDLPPQIDRLPLDALKRAVLEAHDLVGVDGNVAAAAAALRAVMID